MSRIISGRRAPTAGGTAFGLVSRSLPVFVTSGTAANAISSNYNNTLVSTGTPQAVALDISTLSTAQRASMELDWYNDQATHSFESAHSLIGTFADMPAAYTVEGNSGAGGGSPPGSGWTTLATVSGNVYIGRPHSLLDLRAYNWVRLNISSSSNTNLNLKVELYDISAGGRSVGVVGDSRVFFSMSHANVDGTNTCDSFGNLVAAGAFGKVVPQFNMGMSGFKVADMLTDADTYIAIYVALNVAVFNLGTNDATASGWFSQWSTDYIALINKWKATGAICLVETIGASLDSTVNTNVQDFNSHIPAIISSTGAVAGWDAFSFYSANTGLINAGDKIHFDNPGRVLERQQRASFVSTYMAAH